MPDVCCTAAERPRTKGSAPFITSNEQSEVTLIFSTIYMTSHRNGSMSVHDARTGEHLGLMLNKDTQ